MADRQDTGRRWLPGERTCADPVWGIGKLRQRVHLPAGAPDAGGHGGPGRAAGPAGAPGAEPFWCEIVVGLTGAQFNALIDEGLTLSR